MRRGALCGNGTMGACGAVIGSGASSTVRDCNGDLRFMRWERPLGY